MLYKLKFSASRREKRAKNRQTVNHPQPSYNTPRIGQQGTCESNATVVQYKYRYDTLQSCAARDVRRSRGGRGGITAKQEPDVYTTASLYNRRGRGIDSIPYEVTQRSQALASDRGDPAGNMDLTVRPPSLGERQLPPTAHGLKIQVGMYTPIMICWQRVLQICFYRAITYKYHRRLLALGSATCRHGSEHNSTVREIRLYSAVECTRTYNRPKKWL